MAGDTAVTTASGARHGARTARYVHLETGHGDQSRQGGMEYLDLLLQAIALDLGADAIGTPLPKKWQDSASRSDGIGTCRDDYMATDRQLQEGEKPLYWIPASHPRE